MAGFTTRTAASVAMKFLTILPLREMSENDLDAVMAIEVRAYPYPWTRGIFSDCLTHNYHCLVYKDDAGELIAYAVMSVAVEEMHLLNLTVLPERQGEGLGKRLLQTLEMVAKGLDAKTCFLEVRPSNGAALRLYLNHGFKEVGLRKDYYPADNGREHAVVMAKSL